MPRALRAALNAARAGLGVTFRPNAVGTVDEAVLRRRFETLGPDAAVRVYAVLGPSRVAVGFAPGCFDADTRTAVLVRADGRRVALYRIPRALAAPVERLEVAHGVHLLPERQAIEIPSGDDARSRWEHGLEQLAGAPRWLTERLRERDTTPAFHRVIWRASAEIYAQPAVRRLDVLREWAPQLAGSVAPRCRSDLPNWLAQLSGLDAAEIDAVLAQFESAGGAP